MRARLLVAAGLLVATALVGGCSSDGPSRAADKPQLPEVTLQPVGAGKAVDLGSLKGPAVVNLWASYCSPCKRELPIYADFARDFRGKVAVLGVDFQEPRVDRALAMMRTAKVDYPVVADPDGDLRAIALPKLVLVDAAGKVTYSDYVEIKDPAQLRDLVEKHLGVAG